MNGPGMPRESSARKTVEAATIATSQAHAGTARSRALIGKLDLGEPLRDRGRLGRVGADPDLGGARATSPRTASCHGGAAGGLLEGRDVELGDPPDRVLPRRRARAPPPPSRPRTSSRVASSSSAAARVSASCSSTGHLERHLRPAARRTSRRRETISGLPSVSALIAVPEVSPIVGARSETTASQAAISDHRRSSPT